MIWQLGAHCSMLRRYGFPTIHTSRLDPAPLPGAQFGLEKPIQTLFLPLPPNRHGSAVSTLQVAVTIGEPLICPYGYYEGAPYGCAPDGYYGPEWFSGGIFIGAGSWYHGADHFYGHVDHHLDYRKGSHGSMPARGEHAAEHRQEFHCPAMHDVHGHEAPRGHK